MCINHGCFIHTELNVGESCANFTDQCIEGTTYDNGTQTCRKCYPEAAFWKLEGGGVFDNCTLKDLMTKKAALSSRNLSATLTRILSEKQKSCLTELDI